MIAAWSVPLLALAAVLAGVLLWHRRRTRATRETDRRTALRSEWGRPVERARDLEACRAFLRATNAEDRAAVVDDHTWADLDMDAVFERVDRTGSSLGQLVLYRLLRRPTESCDVLRRRERRIALFAEDPGARETVQQAASRLGFNPHLSRMVSLLWNGDVGPIPMRPLFTLMAGLAFASLVSMFSIGALGLLLFAIVFSLNFTLHYRTRFVFEPEIYALGYLSAALAAARDMAARRVRGLEEDTAVLEEAVRASRPLAKRIGGFSSGTMAGVPNQYLDILYEYLNIAFLLEARGLASALHALPTHAHELRRVVEVLGELDALQAVASFRHGLPYVCTPTFAETGVGLEVCDVVHPLLDTPVPNSITLVERGALITGTNMSGKSTFLRALGVNAILAQTIHTCTARRFVASRFRVLASLRPADDVLQGRSLYWAEAERLLEMVRSLDGDRPALCLVDEMLAGTNSAERFAASVEILAFLSRKRALMVSATHDLELTRQLQADFDCYHFEDGLHPDGMRFEYRLRPGLAEERNAIRLLGILGFPEEIVAGALKRVETSPTKDRTGTPSRPR